MDDDNRDAIIEKHKGLKLMEMAGIDLNNIDLTPIVQEYFPLTVLKRSITTIWKFVDVYGHVAVITKRGKPDCVISSLETYLLLTQFSTDEKTLQNRRDVQELIRQRDAKAPHREPRASRTRKSSRTPEPTE